MMHLFVIFASIVNLATTLPEVSRTAAESPQRFVCLAGQVLSLYEDEMTFFDGTNMINISIPPDSPPLTSGDHVRMTGHLTFDQKKQSSVFEPSIIEMAEHGSLPPPIEVNGRQIAEMSFLNRPVRIRGVISNVIRDEFDHRFNWLSLRTEHGTALAYVRSRTYDFSELENLIDAEVSLSGFVFRHSGYRRAMGGGCIDVCARENLQVVRPPSADFSHIPEYQHQIESLHRQRFRGIVLGSRSGCVYVRLTQPPPKSVKFAAVHLSDSGTPPPVGALVTAIGFASGSAFQLAFTRAEIRVDEYRTPPAAIEVDSRDLYEGRTGKDIANLNFNGLNIVITGTAQYIPGTLKANGSFDLADGTTVVRVDVDGMADDPEAWIRSGSRIRVKGLCVAEQIQSHVMDALPMFGRFTILPRDRTDIEILCNPPFWTVGKMFAVAMMLLVLLGGLFFWTWSLKRLSVKRSYQLLQATIRQAKADLKTEERTRLAVELHDSLAQSLTGIALQVNAARRYASKDTVKMLGHLDIATSSLLSCREELRNCLWDLRNDALDEPNMNTAISKTISRHVDNARLVIRFNIPRSRLQDNTAHALLRILRELATNAVRHGQATVIRIAGSIEDDRLLFSVQDNGCGFDPAACPGVESGHFGLDGIRERIRKLGGEIRIDSCFGKGTRVAASLAIHQPEEFQPS